jgi:hypothetical protein
MFFLLHGIGLSSKANRSFHVAYRAGQRKLVSLANARDAESGLRHSRMNTSSREVLAARCAIPSRRYGCSRNSAYSGSQTLS